MKVISIGTDLKLFEEGSAVFERTKGYANKVKEYYSIIYSTKNNIKLTKNYQNLHIYPTNSLSRFFYFIDAYRIANKILEKEGKEDFVLSAQDPFECGLSALMIKRKFGLPLQIQIHTDFLDKHFKKGLLNKVRLLIAKIIVPRANGIRVVSSVIKDSILENIKKIKARMDILPIFVDIEKIQNFAPIRDIKKDFPKFNFIIMMASRLTKEKRIDIAILAMKDIVEAFPNTGVVICGSGPEKSRLESQSRRLGISKNVVFAGWQEDLVSYFKTASLYLLTSEYEGYGMTLIEAGASGCPIVTTKVGLAKTELFKNGYNSSVCQYLDSNCIAKEVIDIMKDNQKRELYKINMKDSIMALSSNPDSYAEKYVGLLEKLLKS